MIHSDRERLHKVLAAWKELTGQLQARNIQQNDVLHDRFTQWAVTTPLYNIGEQTNHLSKELREQYPDIPWKKVSGLRHRLVHHYEGTNWELIVAILYQDMPDYIRAIESILKPERTDKDADD